MTPVQPGGGRRFALELDVLRGLAALLMIVNHAGYRLLSVQDATDSVAAVAVFVGSFAPVVFFFATGFGIALATGPTPRRVDVVGLIWKALLLVVADQLTFWRAGSAWGLDFFSFIALSTVIVSVIAGLRRSVQICVAGVVLLLATRYGLGPALRAQLGGAGVLEWMVGASVIPDVSYPLAPWLVYPLLGFVLGRAYGRTGAQSARWRDPWFRGSLIGMVAACGATLVLLWLKAEFFRWGMMSFASFVLSFGVLAGTAAVAIYLSRSHGAAARWLALRGVGSFAVIPLHFGLLELCMAQLPLPLGQWNFAFLVLAIVMLSFVGAGWFAKAVSGVFFERHRRTLLAGLTVLLLATCASLLWVVRSNSSQAAICVLVGQLAVAALLAIRVTRPAPRAAS